MTGASSALRILYVAPGVHVPGSDGGAAHTAALTRALARRGHLVSAIVGMAHGLGIRVVAEGVETPAILQLLKRIGCDDAQGYVISRPVPVAEAFVAAESEYRMGADEVVRLPGRALAPPLSAAQPEDARPEAARRATG